MSEDVKEEPVQIEIPTPPLASNWRADSKVEWPPKSGNIAAHCWRHRDKGLLVLRSISTDKELASWIHVSVSHKKRLPTYEELCSIRNQFIGVNRETYHLFAKPEDHVNMHKYCLHLWSPLDGKRKVANLQHITWEKGI